MTSLLLAIGAVASLAFAALLLTRVRGYRVARILRSAAEVTIDEAVAASDGEQRYVRVHGRITSAEEFPDEQSRPLVYRSSRVEVAERGGVWRTLEDERVAVPFALRDRTSEIAIDAEALGEGLVVLAREATGSAREAPDRLPRDIPPDARIRKRIDQISAVEHAIGAGVPRRGADGRPILTEGLGRPLILTTLELPAAMRVLSGGQRRELFAAAALLAAAAGFAALALATWVAGVLAPA